MREKKWTEVKALVKNRVRWRHSVDALCTLTDYDIDNDDTMFTTHAYANNTSAALYNCSVLNRSEKFIDVSFDVNCSTLFVKNYIRRHFGPLQFVRFQFLQYFSFTFSDNRRVYSH